MKKGIIIALMGLMVVTSSHAEENVKKNVTEIETAFFDSCKTGINVSDFDVINGLTLQHTELGDDKIYTVNIPTWQLLLMCDE